MCCHAAFVYTYPMIVSEEEVRVLNRISFTPLQGTALFDEYLRITRIFPLGIKCFDDLLGGGIFSGELTEIYGPPGSGKSQFGLSLAANTIYSEESNVIYFDTSNSFQSQRLQEILVHKLEVTSQQDLKNTLQKVSCIKSFNVFEFLSNLENVKTKLLSENDDFCLKLRLIVVDSISSLISPILGGQQTQGHALMTKLGHLLKEIAYDYGIAVLIINSSVGNFNQPTTSTKSNGDRFKPALGKWWSSMPNVRIFIDFLDSTNDEDTQNKRILAIHKHPRLPVRKSAISLYLSKCGVVDEETASKKVSV